MNSRNTPVVILLFAFGFLSACTQTNKEADRNVAGQYSYNQMYKQTKGKPSEKIQKVLQKDVENYGGNIFFTPGLNVEEAADLWHLSEGSDVYPLLWFRHIKSQFSSVQEPTYLYQKLDRKYGVIAEPRSVSNTHNFLLKDWVGLTASWSGEHAAKADVRLKPGQTIEAALGYRKLDSGEKSVAMVGVNCAFCHTNEINVNGVTKIQEGAPNMLNIRGFFQDMFASTAKTMLTPDLLEGFLTELKVPGDRKEIAKEFAFGFYQELGLNTIGDKLGLSKLNPNHKFTPLTMRVGKVLEALDPKKFNDKKQRTLKETFFTKQEVVKKYFVKLLALTYGLQENEISDELKMRMEWLAKSLGVDPRLKITPEGYARTDAFGRISNWVARVDKPISLDATVSVPPMWGIQYKSLFHWNANTNSVVMRNMGQSFGLGSILLHPHAKDDKKWISTSNLFNLHRIEGLLYKIHTPQLQDFVSDIRSEVDIRKAVEGCTTFHNNCAGCHMPDKERVGPQNKLVNYKVLPLEKVGTDATYTINQKTPVNGVAFKDALFHFTGKTRDSFYKRYNVTEEQRADWEMRALRGPEEFRDTYLGEAGHPEVTKYMNIPAKPAPGYVARSLAGAWATAPYLHNGSVPSIADLLTPPEQRPKLFFIGSRIYDLQRLGFVSDLRALVSHDKIDQKAAEILAESKSGKRTGVNAAHNPQEATTKAACELYPANCFDVSWTGNSNKGHPYGTKLTAQEKEQLIEFLKILRPDPEYSRHLDPLYTYDAQSKTCAAVE
jgi:hypothetical protein